MEDERNAYERHVVKNVLSSTVCAGGIGDHYRQQNLRDELGEVWHEFAFDDGGLRRREANSKDQERRRSSVQRLSQRSYARILLKRETPILILNQKQMGCRTNIVQTVQHAEQMQ